ncbi:MAG: DUF2279 domain-containing protein [Flavobacteriales bacterium]|nr:DUF2279 domain-containing protein [Flavobacteriales bacterium]
MSKQILLLLITFIINISCFAQQDSLNNKRLAAVIASESIIYTGTIVGLSQLWYKDVPSTSFHTFNDNQQWLQMDKIGHTVTSYYVGRAGYEVLRWSGVSEKKATWYGGTLGLFLLTSVEVLDGYSADWGFSTGDMLANVSGTGLFVVQQLAWKEQRVLLKYSFHTTDYAAIRPNVLGSNLSEQVLKDYNGQTYWLSANIASFLKDDAKFPKWLNVAVGYGAEGMLGGNDNVFETDGVYYDYSPTKRSRQFYLSLDIDLTRIKTKSKFANTVLGAFGFIKFPFPTLEFNQNGGTSFKGFYF